MEDSARIEIVSGVNEGDRVVVGNRSQYRNGDRVQPSAMEASGGEKAK
jgi:hypothetical protein